jgi:UDP-N-acetylglucosamine/UDP-N-acetylgalactosamine diphosphorylase
MTSPFTDAATAKFFETRRYFGLDPDQVSAADKKKWFAVLNVPTHLSKNAQCFPFVSKRFVSRLGLNLFSWQVTFFQQGTLPCVSADGRFIMETAYRVLQFS